MTDLVSAPPPQLSRWQRFWQELTQNPVTVKELRSRMRGRRAFVVLTIYLLIMAFFVSMIYLAIVINDGGTSSSATRFAGQSIFFTMVSIQAFLVVFIGPAFTAGSISGERERQTYDLLRTTLLSPRSFVAGKLFSALSYVFLLVLSAIPLISMAFMLGGVTLLEVILSQLLLLVSAVAFAMLGLYFSSFMRTTMAASVTTYAAALFLTIGTPILVGISLSIIGPLFLSGTTSWVIEALFSYLGLLISATNLPATLILSELFLREQNAVWGFVERIGPHSLWFFSPWYVFILFYSILSLYFFWRTVKRVDQIANT